MSVKRMFATLGVCSVLALSMVVGTAQASQSSKNAWRNATTGAGAVALDGLLYSNPFTAMVGLAGAGYSAHRYEQDRHNQAVESTGETPKYHRRHHLF